MYLFIWIVGTLTWKLKCVYTCVCACVCLCVPKRGESKKGKSFFFYDFDVKKVILLYWKQKRAEKKSRIAIVHWMTLHTQSTVYDAINMDIQCPKPQSHKYKQIERKTRRFYLRSWPGIFNNSVVSQFASSKCFFLLCSSHSVHFTITISSDLSEISLRHISKNNLSCILYSDWRHASCRRNEDRS